MGPPFEFDTESTQGRRRVRSEVAMTSLLFPVIFVALGAFLMWLPGGDVFPGMSYLGVAMLMAGFGLSGTLMCLLGFIRMPRGRWRVDAEQFEYTPRRGLPVRFAWDDVLAVQLICRHAARAPSTRVLTLQREFDLQFPLLFVKEAAAAQSFTRRQLAARFGLETRLEPPPRRFWPSVLRLSVAFLILGSGYFAWNEWILKLYTDRIITHSIRLFAVLFPLLLLACVVLLIKNPLCQWHGRPHR